MGTILRIVIKTNKYVYTQSDGAAMLEKQRAVRLGEVGIKALGSGRVPQCSVSCETRGCHCQLTAVRDQDRLGVGAR